MNIRQHPVLDSGQVLTPPQDASKPRSLMISATIHLLAVLLAASIRVTVDSPHLTAHPTSVTLIAPKLAPPRATSPRRTVTPRAMHPKIAKPRKFEVPVLTKPNARIPQPVQPVVVETPVPTIPKQDVALTFPRPLPKLGNLTEALDDPPSPANKPVPRVGLFGVEPQQTVAVTPRTFRTSSFSESATVTTGNVQRLVSQGSFGDASAAAASARPLSAAKQSSPLEILSKPVAEYTDEARRLRIQGEVLIEAKLFASGEIEVLRLMRGLGHGLDEAAIAAVRKIRFQPARKAGVAVDTVATLHVQFELAN